MMSPIQYITDQLASLAQRFKNVVFKYGYSKDDSLHVVEISPNVEFESNSELTEAWVPISAHFLSTFKAEDIVFISSDSILALDEYSHVYEAQSCEEEKFHFYDSLIYDGLLINNVDYSFTDEIIIKITSDLAVGLWDWPKAIIKTDIKTPKLQSFQREIEEPLADPLLDINSEIFSQAA